MPPAYARAATALVAVGEPIGVLRGELVAPLAVCLAGVLCTNALAASHIFLNCDRLKVLRIDAAPNAAEVVEGESFGNRPSEYSVGDPVRPSPCIFAKAVLTIACVVERRRPEPAPRRVGVNLRPEAEGKAGVEVQRVSWLPFP